MAKPTTIYLEAKMLIAGKNYQAAFKKLQETTYLHAYLETAKLYLNNEAVFKEKSPIWSDNIEKALECFEKALKKTVKNQTFAPEVLSIVQPLLMQENNNIQLEKQTQRLTNAQSSKLSLIIAKSYYHKFNNAALKFSPDKKSWDTINIFFKYLILSCLYGITEKNKKLLDLSLDELSQFNKIDQSIVIELKKSVGQTTEIDENGCFTKLKLYLFILKNQNKITRPSKNLMSSYLLSSKLQASELEPKKLAEEIDIICQIIFQNKFVNCFALTCDALSSLGKFSLDASHVIYESFQHNVIDDATLDVILFYANRLFLDNYTNEAITMFERAFTNQKGLTPSYKLQQETLKLLYTNGGFNEKFAAFENILQEVDNGFSAYNKAEEFIPTDLKSIADVEHLRIAIHTYKESALRGYKSAMHKLKQLAGLIETNDKFTTVPEALLAIKEIIDIKGLPKKKNNKSDPPIAYEKKARDAYELSLKENRPGILFDYGYLLMHGKLFEKNEFMGRSLLKQAAKNGDKRAYFDYAHACFYGIGGSVNMTVAEEYLLKLRHEIADNEKSQNLCYLLGEYFYYQYIKDRECNQSQNAKGYLNGAAEYFNRAAVSGCEKSFLSLMILAEIDQHPESMEYRDNLREIHRWEQLFQENRAAASPVQPNSMEIELSHAINALQNVGNTLPLRKLAEKTWPKRESAFKILANHYQEKSTGLLNLISSLCYELKKHSFDSAICRVLHELIIGIDTQFSDYTEKNYKDYLKNKETELNNYFDENLSDNSDDEAEQAYQTEHYTRTNSWSRSQEVVAKIKDYTLKKINKFSKKTIETAEEYRKELNHIRDSYTNHDYIPKLKNVHRNKKLMESLEIINQYGAQGKLKEALKIVGNDFLVAQTRGLHFNTDSWSQEDRRKYRKIARDPNHPYIHKPLYSNAVYQLAGVSDLGDYSAMTDLRLEKVARFLYIQMQQLKKLPPHDIQTLPSELDSEHLRKNFKSRNFQVQELYSSNYSFFHEKYLPWAIKQNPPVFFNNGNPLVSFADIQSSHSASYAHGNKIYSGNDHRLRPCYDIDGKCHRPYSGVILLTIHPLSDYASKLSNHIVSLNHMAKLFVSENINPERETSFFTSVGADRLQLIHIAKYPSFHTDYKKTMLFDYGLDEELYNSFKRLLLESAPHSYKRRLLVDLLGEHLCAFHTFCLNRYAFEKITKMKGTMLFRNAYGNFSFTPTHGISPVPSGDDPFNRNKRLFTQQLRTELFADPNDKAPSFPKSKKRVKRSREEEDILDHRKLQKREDLDIIEETKDNSVELRGFSNNG